MAIQSSVAMNNTSLVTSPDIRTSLKMVEPMYKLDSESRAKLVADDTRMFESLSISSLLRFGQVVSVVVTLMVGSVIAAIWGINSPNSTDSLDSPSNGFGHRGFGTTNSTSWVDDSCRSPDSGTSSRVKDISSSSVFETDSESILIPASCDVIDKNRPETLPFQSFDVVKFDPKNPAVSMDGKHAIVATHSGYVVFYTLSEISEEWMRSSIFYHEHEDDTDATVSISGGFAVVGFPDANTDKGEYAGLVYVYELDRNTNKWRVSGDSPLAATEGNVHNKYLFGTSVKVSGNMIVVGAPGYNNYQGSFYVYRREAVPDDEGKSCGKWVQKKHVVSPSECKGSVFGGDIRLSGNTITAGAGCREWMYFFHYDPESNTLTPLQDPLTQSGEERLIGAVTLSKDHFVYSKYTYGIYIYHRNSDDEPYILHQYLNASMYNDEGFGGHVSVNDDTLVVIGDFNIFMFSKESHGLLFEEILRFELPTVGEGPFLSSDHVALATGDDIFAMNLKYLDFPEMSE